MMKKNIFLFTAILLFHSYLFCQIKIPDAVQKAFSEKFPGAIQIKWGKESAKEFEAEFKYNANSVAANFAADGKWIVTETTINEKDLPLSVINTINSKYYGATLQLIEKVEKPGKAVYYEINLIQNGKKKIIEL